MGIIKIEFDEKINQYHQQMPERIKEYLNDRGIDDELIRDFKLGYTKKIYGFNWISIPVKDVNGEYCFIKFRRDPSDDEINPNKYIYFPGGTAQLFNAEAIKNNENILICEGEFDCVVAIGQGIPAVCSTSGAMVFKDEWIELLKHLKEVVICFDNDKTGKDSAGKLAEKLTHKLTAQKISIISLPEKIGDKGDITDYFVKLMAADSKKHNVDNFMDSGVEYKPSIPIYETRRIYTANDILNMTFKEEDDWLIERMVPQSGVTALSAKPGNYKTYLVLYFSYCIINGVDVFGKFKTKKGKVLIVDEENVWKVIRKRLTYLKIKSDDIHFSHFEDIKIDNPKAIDEIIDLIEAHDYKLIIFDALIRLHSQDENAASQMRKIFDCLKPILKKDVAILITHHSGKSDKDDASLRGSSEIGAFVSSHFSIKRENNKTPIITLKNLKMRDYEPLEDLTVKIMIDDKVKTAKFQLIDGQKTLLIKLNEQEKAVLAYIQNSKKELDIDEIKRGIKSKIGLQSLRKILDKLSIEEKINRRITRHNRHLYLKK